MIKRTFSFEKGYLPKSVEEQYLNNLTLFVSEEEHFSWIMATTDFYGYGVYPVNALFDLFCSICYHEGVAYGNINKSNLEKDLDNALNKEN